MWFIVIISIIKFFQRYGRRLQWLQSVFKQRPGLRKKWPVFRYWRQPGHWPSSPSSDHRPETRPGPSDTAWHQTGGSSYLPLSCRAAVCSPHSPVLQTIMQRPETSTTTQWWGCEPWGVKRNCLGEKQGYCLTRISIDRYRSNSVSGLTILIMMKYLLGVRRALLTLRWPCFPTLYNTSLVGLISFIFSTTTRYNPHAMNRG